MIFKILQNLGMRVSALIIDDDRNVALALSELLSSLYIDVIGRESDPLSAIHSFIRNEPDLVFADFSMGLSDGFSVLKNIRSVNTDAKIIIITGDVSIETKQTLERLGITNIVYKPFSITDIKNAIKSELGID